MDGRCSFIIIAGVASCSCGNNLAIAIFEVNLFYISVSDSSIIEISEKLSD